ncbi:MAG: hypothetical protein ABW189_06690, partial [Rickettsiales bacterium]
PEIGKKSGKIGMLEEKFDIKLSDDQKSFIESTKDIRNCLAHRNGIVGENDGLPAKNNQRKFMWTTMTAFSRDSVTLQEFPIEIGKTLSEIGLKNDGDIGDIYVRFHTHERFFDIGKPLDFTSADVYEIAFSLQCIAQNYLTQIQKKFNVPQNPQI